MKTMKKRIGVSEPKEASKWLNRGDIVYFDYGCMHGSDFGTVIGEETTRWGIQVWVRLSDFTLAAVGHINGVVIGTIRKDYEGTPFMSATGVKGIGSYKVELRNGV